MDPCLPGNFARGVHVFQASSKRLPGKLIDFCKFPIMAHLKR